MIRVVVIQIRVGALHFVYLPTVVGRKFGRKKEEKFSVFLTFLNCTRTENAQYGAVISPCLVSVLSTFQRCGVASFRSSLCSRVAVK